LAAYRQWASRYGKGKNSSNECTNAKTKATRSVLDLAIPAAGAKPVRVVVVCRLILWWDTVLVEAGKKNVLCCRWELLTALQLVIPQQPDRLQWSLARHDAMLHKALSLATSLRFKLGWSQG
jgi:hypothetical protein